MLMRETSCCLFSSVIARVGVVESFDTTSRYLVGLLCVVRPYFGTMVGWMCFKELWLSRARSFDIRAPFGPGLVHVGWHCFVRNLW